MCFGMLDGGEEEALAAMATWQQKEITIPYDHRNRDAPITFGTDLESSVVFDAVQWGESVSPAHCAVRLVCDAGGWQDHSHWALEKVGLHIRARPLVCRGSVARVFVATESQNSTN